MKKQYEKIIRHEYEIDENKLENALKVLNEQFPYAENSFDSSDMFCTLADTDFTIFVDGFPETIEQIEMYFDPEFYDAVQGNLCEMIDTFFEKIRVDKATI